MNVRRFPKMSWVLSSTLRSETLNTDFASRHRSAAWRSYFVVAGLTGRDVQMSAIDPKRTLTHILALKRLFHSQFHSNRLFEPLRFSRSDMMAEIDPSLSLLPFSTEISPLSIASQPTEFPVGVRARTCLAFESHSSSQRRMAAATMSGRSIVTIWPHSGSTFR